MTYKPNQKLQINPKDKVSSSRKGKDRGQIRLKIGTPLIQTTFN